MESGKLRQALDEIVRRCKSAGHGLHVFDPSDIFYEEIVGRGEEGIVQLCRVNYHGLEELAAIKTITTNGGKEMIDFLLQELEMIVMGSDALSDAVLKVFGVALVPVNLKTRSHHSAMCHLGIVMERGFCNLFQLLVGEDLDLALRVVIMRQLARAVHHLHSGEPRIVHRDIKPQNIVVTEAERSERTGRLRSVKVKLIDLGMACTVSEPEEKISCVVGTEGYHAPEMWEEAPYTSKVDIFSLGVTFIVVLMDQEALGRISFILGSLHDAKVEGAVGHRLFDVARPFLMAGIEKADGLENLIYAMTTGAATRLSDAGYIHRELTRILDAVSPGHDPRAQTPFVFARGSSREPKQTSAAKRGHHDIVGSEAPAAICACSSKPASGDAECSKDSDYSSHLSEEGSDASLDPSAPNRDSGNVTPTSTPAGTPTLMKAEQNWQPPRYRNFFTQTPNSENFVEALSTLTTRRRATRSSLLIGSGEAADRSHDRIGELEKELEAKDVVICCKEKLLQEREKMLTEQRRSLQKMEIQNKELRQQLILVRARETPSQTRFSDGESRIRPRSLAVDFEGSSRGQEIVKTEVKMEPTSSPLPWAREETKETTTACVGRASEIKRESVDTTEQEKESAGRSKGSRKRKICLESPKPEVEVPTKNSKGGRRRAIASRRVVAETKAAGSVDPVQVQSSVISPGTRIEENDSKGADDKVILPPAKKAKRKSTEGNAATCSSHTLRRSARSTKRGRDEIQSSRAENREETKLADTPIIPQAIPSSADAQQNQSMEDNSDSKPTGDNNTRENLRDLGDAATTGERSPLEPIFSEGDYPASTCSESSKAVLKKEDAQTLALNPVCDNESETSRAGSAKANVGLLSRDPLDEEVDVTIAFCDNVNRVRDESSSQSTSDLGDERREESDDVLSGADILNESDSLENYRELFGEKTYARGREKRKRLADPSQRLAEIETPPSLQGASFNIASSTTLSLWNFREIPDLDWIVNNESTGQSRSQSESNDSSKELSPIKLLAVKGKSGVSKSGKASQKKSTTSTTRKDSDESPRATVERPAHRFLPLSPRNYAAAFSSMPLTPPPPPPLITNIATGALAHFASSGEISVAQKLQPTNLQRDMFEMSPVNRHVTLSPKISI